MKNTVKLFVLIALMFSAMSVLAQQKPVKLGHIEMGKVIQSMPEFTAAEKELQQKQDDIMKENENLNTQYQALVAEYGTKKSTYSEAVKATKEKEIMDLQGRIQSFREIAAEQFDQDKNKMLQPIMEKASKAVQEVGKEQGFTYIFDMGAGVILFAAESSEDILPLVKTKLGIQ